MRRILIICFLLMIAGTALAAGKYWNGTSWVDATRKRWSGTEWVETTTYRYNGSSWDQINVTAPTNNCTGIVGTQTVYAASTPGTNAYHEVTRFDMGCGGSPVSINATVGSGEFILVIYADNNGEPGNLLWASSQIDETTTSAHTITAPISGLSLPETTNIWLGLTASRGSTYYRENDYGTADIGRNMADGTSGTVAPSPNDPWNTSADGTYQRRRTVWLQF